MRRLHVIEDYDRIGGEVYFREDKFAHDPELLKAYKCGKKDGWREAMEEADSYRERRVYDHDGIIKYRHDDYDDWDDDDYMERRRRSRRTGRYI